MIITALAAESYMEYEFTYENNYELATILFDLERFKNKGLCKEYAAAPNYDLKSTSGNVYACIRSDCIGSLCHKLNHFIEDGNTCENPLIKIEKAVKRTDDMILPIK